MAPPQTWAEIAEKLGIPFAIVLLLFFGAFTIFMWLARNVIKPVTKAHLEFVTKTSETSSQLATVNAQQVKQLDGLAEQTRDHDRRTMDHLERAVRILERGCPLLQPQKPDQAKPDLGASNKN